MVIVPDINFNNVDINADEVERTARELSEISQLMSQQSSQLSEISDKLQNSVINQHMGIYNSISEAMKKDIADTAKKIDSLSDYLMRAAAAVRKAESDIKKSMLNL